ncbi:MAG: HD family phosphohydrolase [Gemmatimonadota bacterium]
MWTRVRDALRAVSRSPAGLSDEAVHHGFRVLLVLAIALLLPWLFPRLSLPEFEGLREGEIADRDVIARIPFTVFKSAEQLTTEREEAQAAVAPIFVRDTTVADSASAEASALFARLDSVVAELEARASQETEADAAERRRIVEAGITDLITRAGIQFPTQEQIGLLADETQRRSLRNAVVGALRRLLRQSVIRGSDLRGSSPHIIVRREGKDRLLSADSLMTVSDLYGRAIAGEGEPLGAAGVQLFHTLLVLFVEPTLRVDQDATRAARNQARDAVIQTAGFVQQGERIIARHEPIGSEEWRKLQAYQERLREEGLAGVGSGFWRGLGLVLYGASLLGILAFAVYIFRRDIYEDARSVSVLFILLLLVLATAGLIGAAGAPPALIPIAFAALIVGALFDSFLALVCVATVAGLLLAQPSFEGLEVPALVAGAGAAAAFAVREIRRRSQSWILIATITAGYVLIGVTLLMMGQMDWGRLAATVAWGFGSATVSTALAMGAVLPALETFTRRTTDQTLLELADMNRPILRQLAREAPGTYAHSVNVANLAEAACATIGADSMLARVGVYYHDIGKLARPQYFIENQPSGLNPHDRLRPWQSAELLREHVREGLRLAEEAKLPGVVKDFIREHHGTQQIRYFLAKAREEDPDLALDPNDFCYPGPKPQTKETAVVMLADAIESASRTLANPSPERIRELIARLVTARVEEGQLDECALTFRDLDRVKSEFAHVLTGLYHHRIDYPEPLPAGERPAGDPDDAQSLTTSPELRVARALDPESARRRGPTLAPEQAAASDTGPPPTLETLGETGPRAGRARPPDSHGAAEVGARRGGSRYPPESA